MEGYRVINLPNGRVRVERILQRDGETSYHSVTVRDRDAARLWIASQQANPDATAKITYNITRKPDGTFVVSVATDGVPQTLGAFDTIEQAQEFERRMGELDRGPSHGRLGQPASGRDVSVASPGSRDRNACGAGRCPCWGSRPPGRAGRGPSLRRRHVPQADAPLTTTQRDRSGRSGSRSSPRRVRLPRPL
jgi:hypothetical protein